MRCLPPRPTTALGGAVTSGLDFHLQQTMWSEAHVEHSLRTADIPVLEAAFVKVWRLSVVYSTSLCNVVRLRGARGCLNADLGVIHWLG
jgi:hypothetical protein